MKGGEIEGEGEIENDASGFKDDNDIEGEVDGNNIEWTFEVSDDYGDFEVNLDGEFDGSDTIKGDCEIRQISGGDFLAKGDLKLRRD